MIMFYLFKHLDTAGHATTDVVWQYQDEESAQDAADLYNSNLSEIGIPSWVCCYYVGQ